MVTIAVTIPVARIVMDKLLKMQGCDDGDDYDDLFPL
jgi:hypothetical protein